MSTVPKIFNVNSAKVSPILPLMQFWEARKNNHYEYQWPLTITFWVCKTLWQIMIEILKICSPHPMTPPSIWTIAFSNCSHSCLFFSRSNYFKSILKYIQPLSVVRKFLYHQINDQNQKQIPCGWSSYWLLCKWQYDSGCIIWSFAFFCLKVFKVKIINWKKTRDTNLPHPAIWQKWNIKLKSLLSL